MQRLLGDSKTTNVGIIVTAVILTLQFTGVLPAARSQMFPADEKHTQVQYRDRTDDVMAAIRAHEQAVAATVQKFTDSDNQKLQIMKELAHEMRALSDATKELTYLVETIKDQNDRIERMRTP